MRHYLNLFVTGIWFCGMGALATPATRIAILPATDTPDVQVIAELAEAFLSQDSDIELLDRRSIDAVLQEQQLQLSGIVNVNDGLQVGRLLHTEIIAIIQQPDPDFPPTVMAYDIETGIHLTDIALPDGNADTQAKATAEAIHLALAKQQQHNGTTYALSLLSLQNVDLPPQQEYFIETIGTLLERELLHASSISILERKHLDQVNKERNLHGGVAGNALLASVCLLELNVMRGKHAGEIQVSARMSDPGGEVYTAFDITTNAAAVNIVQQLTDKITEQLKVTPPAKTNRKIEARRYHGEAKWLSLHNRPAEAQRAAEAAYALDSENTAIMENLAFCRIQNARNTASDASPLVASSALDMLFQLRAENIVPKAEYELYNYLINRRPSARRDPSYNQQLRSLQRNYLDYLGVNDAPNDAEQWLTENMEAGYAITRLAVASQSSHEYIPLLTLFTKRWLDKVQKNPEDWRYFYLGQVMRTIREGEHHAINPNHHVTWFDWDDYYYEGLLAIFRDMENHPVVFIAPYGKLGQLYCRRQTENMTPEQVLSEVQKIDREVRNTIANDKTCTAADRYMLYTFLLDLYDLIQDDTLRHACYFDLFDFMAEQKTLAYPVVHAATSQHAGFRDYEMINGVRPLNEEQRKTAVVNNEQYHDMVRNIDQYEYVRSNDRFDDGIQKLRKILKSNSFPTTEVDLSRNNARCLFDTTKKKDINRIERITEHDNSLFVLSSAYHPHKPSLLRLDRVDLKSGQSFLIATGSVCVSRHYPSEIYSSYPQDIYFGPICRTENTTWIPTYGNGLVCMHDNGNVEPWTVTNGLPSDYIQSVTVMSNVLYVSSGEIGKAVFLSAYDMQNESWTLLASSLRRTQDNPLDHASPPFMIRSLIPDSPRNRLIFTVDYGLDCNNHHDYSPLIGIWEYSIDTHTFKQRLQLYRSPRWVAMVGTERLLLAPWSNNPYQPGSRYRPWQGLVVFDLTSDKAGIIMEAETRPVSPALKRTDAGLHTQQIIAPPYAVYKNGVYYMDQTLGKLSFKDGRKDYSFGPKNARSHKLPELLMVGTNNNQLVATTYKDLWLIECDPEIILQPRDWEAFLSHPITLQRQYSYPDAQNVVLAGEFNEWDQDATPCQRNENGLWTVRLNILPGQYAYKLVVDGEWLLDPHNTNTVLHDNIINSLLTVP